MFGMELVFNQAELAEATQTMEVDPIGRRLPTGEFSFSAVNVNLLTGNQNGMYDPDNSRGVWKYFEQRNPITVRYGQQLTGGMKWSDAAALKWADLVVSGWKEIYQGGIVEWIPGGRFYLTGQPAVEGLYAKFSATDALGLLDGSYYKGIWDNAIALGFGHSGTGGCESSPTQRGRAAMDPMGRAEASHHHCPAAGKAAP